MIILDGGMGRELESMGAPFSQPFLSAQALIEAPEIVAKAHRNFIQSGAEIITTNCYAVTPPHIGEDLFYKRGAELIGLSAQIARREADNASNKVKVAGCVPPVFGSYKPEEFNEVLAPKFITAFFKGQEEYVDFFLGETISSSEEALMIIKVYKELNINKPLWLSFTLKELFDKNSQPQLRSGENLLEVLEKIIKENATEAILFNCCSVEDINAAFTACEEIIKNSSVQMGAYANLFGRVNSKRNSTAELATMREDVSPETYLEYAKEWKVKGASIIGGCCGIGPEYIKLLSENL